MILLNRRQPHDLPQLQPQNEAKDSALVALPVVLGGGGGMHVAKCEGCEKEIEFATYKRDWPEGWILTGRSQWGKKYHRRSGWGWWCPECDKHKVCLNKMLDKLPSPVQRALRERSNAIITLQGYSYPNPSLADVIAHEARQGRTVNVVIEHAGGWVVSGGPFPDVAADEKMEFLQERAKRSIPTRSTSP